MNLKTNVGIAAPGAVFKHAAPGAAMSGVVYTTRADNFEESMVEGITTIAFFINISCALSTPPTTFCGVWPIERPGIASLPLRHATP